MPPSRQNASPDADASRYGSGAWSGAYLRARELPVLTVFTGILWLTVLTVGAVGLECPYARPHRPPAEPEPVVAETLHVDLTNDPTPPPDSQPPLQDALQPPPATDAIVPPDAPPLIPVAKPDPTIAFSLPVEGPTREVEKKQATHARPAPSVTPRAAAPAAASPGPVGPPRVQNLTFGQGEGRQPAPEYPRMALESRQEGSVRIRFSVGPGGQVLSAEVSEPSQWPLLNQAALRAVRDRWHFSGGLARIYEVTIHFKIR